MRKPTLPPDNEHYYYYLVPEYDHYKTVKVIDRCEHCGHKTGVHLEDRGVKVIGWELKREVKDARWHQRQAMMKPVVDAIFSSSPLIERLLGKK